MLKPTNIQLTNSYYAYILNDLAVYKALDLKKGEYVDVSTDKEIFKYKPDIDINSYQIIFSKNGTPLKYSDAGFIDIEIIEKYKNFIKSFFRLTSFDDNNSSANIIDTTEIYLGEFAINASSPFVLYMYNPVFLNKNSAGFYRYAV